jgi:hypothetical protein
MHPWAKRGLQSAMLAGGLMMLGTGIASAEEQVNPDLAPSPLDGGASVPIQIRKINLGTPAGEAPLPLDTDTDVTTGTVLHDTSKPLAGALLGNVVKPDVSAPVQITGWAVGAGGDSHVVNDSQQVHQQGGPITTTGEGKPLGGNVVTAPVTAPIGVNNLAFGTLSNATVDGFANQDSTVGGPVTTNGDNGVVSGTIAAARTASPPAPSPVFRWRCPPRSTEPRPPGVARPPRTRSTRFSPRPARPSPNCGAPPSASRTRRRTAAARWRAAPRSPRVWRVRSP